MADEASRVPNGDSAGALQVIARRRSVGVVARAAVERGLIETVLRAGAAAPNHKNTEPWRFVVLEDGARRTLGEAHARAAARVAAGPIDHDREVGRFERAPVVIVCICATDPTDSVRAREDRDAVCAGVENMLLAAEALGLAAMWRTGAIAQEDEVRSELGLDEDAEIVAFVYLGWPRAGRRPSAPSRRPLSQIVEWRST
jgi:nitroreductase